MNVVVRPWHQDSLETVRSILLKSWKESYSNFIPAEDLLAYFNDHVTMEILTEQLHDPGINGYIAECDGHAAGFEKTHYHESEHRFSVLQLYILSSYQNRGLGRLLMKTAAERARSLGSDKVWLGVMVKNTPAVEWYTKMGYEVTEHAPFTMGSTTVDHMIGYVPVGRILTDAT
ncbi:MAG: GNAT family N-acetyltransferase [Ignavibacteriae bacterium]|nr:MAG: GNAT family N-acetyltransferase [Ignavibacteriota bacterium]